MTGILLLGISGDHRIAGILRHLLERSGPVMAVSNRQFCIPNQLPDYCILCSESVCEVQGNNILVVFGSHLPPDHSFQLENGSIAIVRSDNSEAIALAAQHQIRAVTCGLSHRDTLTISSLTSDNAVISLQRSVSTFSGCIIDPCDLPVSFHTPMDAFSILLIAAVLLLTDNLEQLSHGSIDEGLL